MKLIKSAMLAVGLFLLAEPSAFAQGPGTTAVGPVSLKSVGAGIVIVGAALGIGMIGKAAVESIAQQPEIANNIQTAMIIAAALIEGVTFFALLVVYLANY